MATPMITAAGLQKSFGDVHALRGVDLEVAGGEILGLLGPNGAGKTTTINVLTTLLRPDAGTATIDGVDVLSDPAAARARIGLTGQFAAIDDILTGRENLVLFGRLLKFGRAGARLRADELLSAFDLEDAADRRVSTYSGGMRRRLDLAASMVARPPVLFLDEPTTGLDPRSRRTLWDVVRRLRDGGTTILLTTQYLAEADELADRIVVIDHGSVIAEGTAPELKQRVGGAVCHLAVDEDQVEAVTAALAERWSVTAADGGLAVPAASSTTLVEVVRLLDERRITVADIGLRQPTLDDVFLALTGTSSGESSDPGLEPAGTAP